MFKAEDLLPDAVLRRLTDLRVAEGPRLVGLAARKRRRRASLTGRSGAAEVAVTRTLSAPAQMTGKLTVLAVDHPARHVTHVGDDPLGMADRRDLLARTVRVLQSGAVDGVMASLDVLEDLLLLDLLALDAGAPRLLDDKCLVASLNRGGLAGAAWELDDPLTGPEPQACAALHLDGCKSLLRVCLSEKDSLRTLEQCGRWITLANAAGLATFLEPLVVERSGAAWKVKKDPVDLAKLVGVASALGDSSARLWLKLPFTPDFHKVARATTLPILLLGGESAGDVRPLFSEVSAGMAAGHNVRGVMVGRNVLYPGALDPAVAARAVDGIVHQGWTPERAAASLEEPGPERTSLERWLR